MPCRYLVFCYPQDLLVEWKNSPGGHLLVSCHDYPRELLVDWKFSYSRMKLPAGRRVIASSFSLLFVLNWAATSSFDQAFPEEAMTRTNGYSLTCLTVDILWGYSVDIQRIFRGNNDTHQWIFFDLAAWRTISSHTQTTTVACWGNEDFHDFESWLT